MWMKAPGRAADVVVGQRHVTVAFACAHRSLPFLRCFSKEFPFTLRFLKNIVVSQATNVCRNMPCYVIHAAVMWFAGHGQVAENCPDTCGPAASGARADFRVAADSWRFTASQQNSTYESAFADTASCVWSASRSNSGTDVLCLCPE